MMRTGPVLWPQRWVSAYSAGKVRAQCHCYTALRHSGHLLLLLLLLLQHDLCVELC